MQAPRAVSPETVVLSRAEVARLLDLSGCIAAVEQAFRLFGAGKVGPPGILGVPARGGGFHLKAACLELGRLWFAVKCNGNFPANPERGRPTVQGVIALCDGTDGAVLALMDSIEITALRTGAATAVAARVLARPGSRVATICGCGVQGRVQLRSLLAVLPLTTVYLWDREESRAVRLASEAGRDPGIKVTAVADFREAARQSDVVVTCTPATRWFLGRDHVRPGTFIAAVGADDSHKQEIEPELLAGAVVVPDLLDQAAAIGDLHHALEQGLLQRDQVAGELGQVLAGVRPGRRSDQDIVVFDSTGTALQDVAAAAVVYQRALETRAGLRLALGA